jgi:hypothetical protein
MVAADPGFPGHAAAGQRPRKPAAPKAGRAEVQARGRAPGGAGIPGPASGAIAAPRPESLVIDGVRSLEVRWIFPGRLEAAVAAWFGRFPAGVESREDTYLLSPPLRLLSVKIRGGQALEVKAYGGSPGILEVPGRARGRMEDWQKWSYLCGPLSQDSGDPACWRAVRKRRRINRFSLARGQIVARAPRGGHQPRCEVELTEIRTPEEDWWSLGFEATGPADRLRAALEATAALVFAQALPGGMELGPDHSRSYAEWLGQLPGTGHNG